MILNGVMMCLLDFGCFLKFILLCVFLLSDFGYIWSFFECLNVLRNMIRRYFRFFDFNSLILLLMRNEFLIRVFKRY